MNLRKATFQRGNGEIHLLQNKVRAEEVLLQFLAVYSRFFRIRVKKVYIYIYFAHDEAPLGPVHEAPLGPVDMNK